MFSSIKNCVPKQYELRNGVLMPSLGLGTSHSGGYSHDAVVNAIKSCGYRLIDTAKRYGCENLLSLAIKESGVGRNELFITSKLWPTDYGSQTTRDALFGTLQRLDIETIDLFMLHWPECPSSCYNKKQLLEDTWRELELIYDEGYCNSIGVCNFEINHLEDLIENCTVIPHVNQFELHPFQNPIDLREFCMDHGIQVEGYCPLGKGTLINEPAIVAISNYHHRTPAQILIRWSLQNGAVTIPKSTKSNRVKENCQVFDFELSPKDMKVMDALHDGRRIVSNRNLQAKIDANQPDGYKLLETESP